ncbi:MAG: acyl-CoA-binding domain-containing protein [Thermaurantimonas sp.]
MFLDEIALHPISRVSESDFELNSSNIKYAEFPLDIRIQLEAYKNQATIGDNPNPRPQRYSMVIETLLHDAWQRLHGTPKEVAKQMFIQLIEKSQRELSSLPSH